MKTNLINKQAYTAPAIEIIDMEMKENFLLENSINGGFLDDPFADETAIPKPGDSFWGN